MGTLPEDPAHMIMETAPLIHTGHLLHKTILLRLRNVVNLPNTQKCIQRGKQNVEPKEHTPPPPIKTHEKYPRKN